MTVRIRRVTTTRAGGVSKPPFDTFNLADHVGDDPRAVIANRSRLAAAIGLPAERVVWMNQVHGDHVVSVDEPRCGPVDDTDAIVTTTGQLALAVLSADCVPVLLSDARAGVVAAVHAGRRGAACGVVLRTVEVMLSQGAHCADIAAFLGPAISGVHYEVPEAMAADVEARLPGSRMLTHRSTPGLDMRRGIIRQLTDIGITAIDSDRRCTVSDPTLFSYRRDAVTGRLACVVWMS